MFYSEVQNYQNFTHKAKEIDIVFILICDEYDGHTVVDLIEAQRLHDYDNRL
jgi:hypothetical protein